MAFILADQRGEEAAFDDYRAYLKAHANQFPPHAHKLATSNWYFSFGEKSPHDARLVSCAIIETSSFSEGVAPKVNIRLLNAMGNGFVDFEYPEVYSYSLNYAGKSSGHMDWRYDEFRLSPDGHLLHEIEWWGPFETGRWLIEASDVIYRWSPK